MRKLIWFCLALLFLTGGQVVLAQTPVPTPTPPPTAVPRGTFISLPANNATVRGKVTIFGSAWRDNFDRYEVYYVVGSQQVFMGRGDQTRINATLYEWNTVGFKDGTYVILLRAVSKDGNYSEARVTVRVDNTSPPTPTPTPTEGPTATPEPTRTPLILPGATPQRTVTPTPATTPRAEGGLLPGLPSISLDPTLCLRPLGIGAALIAVFFLLMGLLAIIRRLLGR